MNNKLSSYKKIKTHTFAPYGLLFVNR